VTGAKRPAPESFLSGETGHVAGIRRRLLRSARDRALDLAGRRRARALDRLAASTPTRTVLAVGIYRPGSAQIESAVAELERTRHELETRLGSTGEPIDPLRHRTAATHMSGGKFENLNLLLEGALPRDWLLVVDDDVVLPRGFLDRFVALCEHFDLALAQPAQTLMSHAAWRVTRRRARSLVRETRFVEIGPVTAFRRDAAAQLVPFPPLRYGWGLDLHWAALAAERGWRLGIVDALPVRHEGAPVGSAYGFEEAIEEAQEFLAARPFITAIEAQRTVTTHRALAR
jgi:hypothetical protein